jgi:hypothetical protein
MNMGPSLIWTLALGLSLAGLGGCGDATPAGQETEDLDGPHRKAAGLLARYDYGDAVRILQSVIDRDPDRLDAQIDLAIATMNRQEENDEANALAMLDDVHARHPNDPRASFVSSVLHLRAGNDSIARDRLAMVLRDDESDPFVWYHYGLALERDDPEAAAEAYQRAVTLDPYQRSGWYRLGSVAARLGNDATADAALATFERLENNPRATTVRPIYGRLGPKSMARPGNSPTTDHVRPSGGAWSLPEPLSIVGSSPNWGGPGRYPIPTVADLDDDGRLDIFIASAVAGEAPNAVLLQVEDGFQLANDHPLATIQDVRFASFADIDQDGRTDAYLAVHGPNRLFFQRGPGSWIDVTNSTNTSGGDFDTRDVAIVDADHDGDLDIVLANGDGPDALLNNDRNGRFTDLAKVTGVGGDAGSHRILAADLDGTRDLDILVIRESPPHLVHLNDRLWSYRHEEVEFDRIRNADLVLATSGDLDGDGIMDLVTANRNGDVQQWVRDKFGVFEPRLLHSFDAPPDNLAIMDVDGDGRLEIVTDSALGMSSPVAWTPMLADPGSGYGVIALTSTGVPQMIAPGPGRFAFTAVQLAGAEDTTQAMRSNADGIGAILAARLDERWTIKANLRPDAGPGQSRQPVPFGLGGAETLSYLLIDWPDGLFQGEVPGVGDAGGEGASLAAGSVDRISEIQRQVSSCPVLFAYDGEDYRFVSDVLGVGGVGYLLAPGVYSEPRPFERFPMPQGSLAPDEDGQLRLVLCEPMEEVCYLDAVELVGWSLPEAWSLAVDERLAIEGPAATGEPIFFRTTIDPVAATNDRGDSILDAVTKTDRSAAPLPQLDHRFIGRLTDEHVVTLEFDRTIPAESDGRTPWLLMDGWVEYPYAQTMFAAWQADATYDAPTLEARDAHGDWFVVQQNFGYPAGMPRTSAFPLPDLPDGCDALRLRTNQEIYWDRLRVVIGEPAPAGAYSVRVPPTAARFSAIGFPKRINRPQRRPDYDWSTRSPLWDVRHQRGLYTHFGDVLRLLSATDGAVVTIGPGEGVELTFTAPPRAGSMHWILDNSGWCKDRDRFTRDGETLDPIPGADLRSDAATKLMESTRTRIEAGR